MKDKIKVNTHTHTYTFQLALFSFAHLCDCCYCCYEVSFHLISKQHWEWEISFFFVRYSIITNHFQKLIFVTNFLIVNWQPNKCGLKTRCVCACAHINSIVELVDFYKMGLASLTTFIHSLFLCVCVSSSHDEMFENWRLWLALVGFMQAKPFALIEYFGIFYGFLVWSLPGKIFYSDCYLNFISLFLFLYLLCVYVGWRV